MGAQMRDQQPRSIIKQNIYPLKQMSASFPLSDPQATKGRCFYAHVRDHKYLSAATH